MITIHGCGIRDGAGSASGEHFSLGVDLTACCFLKSAYSVFIFISLLVFMFMLYQKLYSPGHRPAYVCLMALLLLLPLGSDAQKKNKNNAAPKGYGKAVYTTSSFGKPMENWLVAGPLLMLKEGESIPDDARQSIFFAADPVSEVSIASGKENKSVKKPDGGLVWSAHTAEQGMVDFDQLFNQADFAAAYALAEVKADAEQHAYLSLGSDDGIKVWLNGKLVHEFWGPRGIVPDQDLIPLVLRKGSNQLLIKVQDMQGDWGFTARFLDDAALVGRLVTAAGKGALDEVGQLLARGADINKKNTAGLTPLNSARLAGRQEMVSLLLEKGAVETPMPAPGVLADQLFTSLQVKDAPGIAVLVSKKGEIVYRKGFGYADLSNKVPITPETKFRIGSVTKQFVAAALLKLQEEGKLQLTDKLSQYFPDIPRAEEVSLHHLLTHTSGIHSYTSRPDFISKVTRPVNQAEMLAIIKEDPYDFNPGDAYSYNNSGYMLAGFIVEKVSGKSLDQYLKDAFFKPLQMNNTGIHTSALELENEALGYGKAEGSYSRDIDWDMSWAGGAGALYSTVGDLFKWNEALYRGKILSEASLKAALTPVVLNDGSMPQTGGIGYGYGLMMGSYRNQDVVMHSGGLHGFISQLAYYPQEEITVVLLTNLTPGEQHLDPNTLAEYYAWEKMGPQDSFKELAGSEEDLDKYAGRYDFGNGIVMMVSAEKTALYAQLSGQARFQIYPSAPGEYFWKVVDAKIKFVSDQEGRITHADFEQNGNALKVQRLKDEKVVAVDPKVYEAYKGTYDFGNNFKVEVTKEGDKLFALATNNPKMELLPLSENEFFAREFNVRLTFATESGKDNPTLLMNLGGRKLEAKRSK